MESARHDVIANNIANVNTPGFKEDLAVIRARSAEAVEDSLPAYATPMDGMGGGALVSETYTRHGQGPIHVTGNPLDLAIKGKGFFKVTGDDGTFYTRAGAFRRDAEGRLAMPDGRHFLASSSGAPIVVPPDGEVSVADDGTVNIDASPVARVDIAQVSSTRALSKVAGNLYINNGAAVSYGGALKSGALEESAVSPALELANMIAASRGYEANMQLLRMQDQTLSDLLSIGRVTI